MPPKKIPLTKKIILIGGVLIVVQGIYVAIFSTDDQKIQIKDAITTQVANHPKITADRKDLVKLQLALSSFKVKNKAYPKQLGELVPAFIEALPLDPKTGTQFKYSTTGERYVLGDPKPASGDPKGSKSGTSNAAAGSDEQSQLIAYLDTAEGQESYTYDRSEKKDPFRSYDFTSKTVETVGDTPLESLTYDELKLAAILEGAGEPKAIIEDLKGKGHVVGVGTKIGNMGGVIKQIEKNKIVILEQRVDFTGETTSRTVEMLIR